VLTHTSVFLPAADIPRFVALGSVSLGITGQDVIAESTHASQIQELLPLGFGKCKLQVQVPVTGPVQTVEQLSGKRVATSFEVLAGELFKDVDAKVGGGKATSVEYVGGSVEAACALGMADGIGELRAMCGSVLPITDSVPPRSCMSCFHIHSRPCR
jgi:ATP phosphoribosyltransferase